MSFGIADLSITPVRTERSSRSEMFSQLLFGEAYEVLEEEPEWMYIRFLHDDGKGWLEKRFFKQIDPAYAHAYSSSAPFLASDIFSLAIKKGEWENCFIAAGSVLPFYDPATRKMYLGDDEYTLLGTSREAQPDNTRALLIHHALMYYNAPYLWRGRTPRGIDASGLVQIAYRLSGISMPRETEQQATAGKTLSFLEEALPGDLAFFGDAAGSITHAGILWEQGRIIHASGRVRVDKIDHHGIFNEETKRYTHALKTLKQII